MKGGKKMYKILASASYKGEYNGKQFEKICMIVSKEGRYPQLVSVDKAVYDQAQAIINARKPVKLLYDQQYGKFRIVKIEEA